MSIAPMNVSYQSTKPTAVHSINSTSWASESLNESIIAAFLNDNPGWIEEKIIDRTIDPNIMVKLDSNSSASLLVHFLMNPSVDSLQSIKDLINEKLKDLSQSQFDGDTDRLITDVKYIEWQAKLFIVLDSDASSSAKQAVLEKIFQEYVLASDEAGLSCMEIPLLGMAKEANFKQLVEVLESYGANPNQ